MSQKLTLFFMWYHVFFFEVFACLSSCSRQPWRLSTRRQLHCNKVDPSQWLKNILWRNNLRTFSELGFAVGTPQTPPTTAEFEQFCTGLNGGVDMSISEASKVRRLLFEACTMIVAHTKQQVAGDASTDGVKKLPVAEKQARLVQQQQRLVGLSITGELQPSFALIDLAASMLDTNSVVWIAPSKCSKRETELQMVTKDKPPVLAVEQHTLKVTAPEVELKVDTSTELQLQWCLMRRGIALDQCRLIEWATHQRWVQYLLNLLGKQAPDGYSRVRMDQLVRADKELFMIMAEELQQANKQLSETPSPMNEAMEQLRTDPRVTMHLLPLPGHRQATSSAASGSTKVAPPPAPVSGTKRQKQKTLKQSSKARTLCPAELKEFKQTDDEGRPICWAFNTKAGCKEAVSGGKCKKGVHICIKCRRSNHSFITCRAAGA